MAKYIKKAPPQKAQDVSAVEETARRMLADIKENGDAAVSRYATELDKWRGRKFRVTEDQIAAAEASLPETFKEDFEFCHRQITQFAQRQLETLTEFECETEPGIVLGQKQIPVTNIGCYIPGGKYPLVAAASMSVGVARTAGVEHIIGCAPPRDGKEMYAPTLFALHKAGADEIYALGGIQAMASMAFASPSSDDVTSSISALPMPCSCCCHCMCCAIIAAKAAVGSAMKRKVTCASAGASPQ